jgi:hypothetical protein
VVAGGASALVAHRRSARLEAQLAAERGQWTAEKAELSDMIAHLRTGFAPAPRAAAPAPTPLSPREIIGRLQRLPPGSATRSAQMAVYWLEELTRHGQAALPAIADFLATNRDLDLDTSWIERGRNWRDRLPDDFVSPPSLRFGLFDVVRRIGGRDAEDLLGVALTTTGRGVELAFLTRVLHETASGRHREAAVTAARQLLVSGAAPPSASPLDRNHRDHLFAVLAFYKDPTYVSHAQAQLVSSDGVDRAALDYLRRTLGPQSVAVAAQAYQDQRLTDPAKKNPLARLALDFVGADPAATEMWQKVINDLTVPKGQRQDLIEDLNENGFPDPKKLTPGDLPLIEARIALIEKLAPTATDPVNAAAFKEAYKDLQEMRRRLQGTP